MIATNRTGGRQRGVINRGYFYRSGRGWSCTINGSKVLLRDAQGNGLTDRNASKKELTAAVERLQQRMIVSGDDVPVATIADAYLAWLKSNWSENTFKIRAAKIFNFVTGYPPRFRTFKEQPDIKLRQHSGFGKVLVSELTASPH